MQRGDIGIANILKIAFNKACGQRSRTLRVQDWNPVEKVRRARGGDHRSIAVSSAQCWRIVMQVDGRIRISSQGVDGPGAVVAVARLIRQRFHQGREFRVVTQRIASAIWQRIGVCIIKVLFLFGRRKWF